MRLQCSELENGIRLIKLKGALDALGIEDIEVEFMRCCAGEGVCILVDLSRVNYISSLGIPLLINSARSIANRGGKMALFTPQKSVENILDLIGIPLIIPIYKNLTAATLAMKK